MTSAHPGPPSPHTASPVADGGGDGEDSLGEVTGGDAAATKLLRENLTGLAREHRGTPAGQLLDDVLTGRRPAGAA